MRVFKKTVTVEKVSKKKERGPQQEKKKDRKTVDLLFAGADCAK